MAVKVTFSVSGELSPEKRRALQLLLCDALGEFQSHRGPTSEAYVDRRYPDASEHYRTSKVRQTDERKVLAEEIRELFAGGQFGLE